MIIKTVAPTTSTDGTDVVVTSTVDSNATWSAIEWGVVVVPAGNDYRRRQLPFVTTSGYLVRATAGSTSRWGDLQVSNNYKNYSGTGMEISYIYTKPS